MGQHFEILREKKTTKMRHLVIFKHCDTMWKKRQREKFRFHLFNARCTTDSRVAIEAQNAHKKIKWKQFSVCKCITLQKKSLVRSLEDPFLVLCAK